MSDYSHVRSAHDIRRGLLKSAFQQNRPGVVVRIQERRQKVAEETKGARDLIANFNFQHYAQNREERAQVLVAQKEGRDSRSPFSLEIPVGSHPN